MSQTPFAHAESLRIGTVDFVSPDEVKVLLEIEAPESVALNADGVRPFPRVNGYVVIPVDDGYLVGQIEWLTIERSAFPKRKGIQDFGLVDLPYPLRKMSLNPLGTLRRQTGQHEQYRFRRGADAFPSVGGAVLLPTEKQLHAIVESNEQRRVRIGTSPLAGNAEVCIDPDRLFGRHLAVLGNTGSGKSCSVAGLIRWSLEAAKAQRQGKESNTPNARFIVLDPNGEYSRAFSGSSPDLNAKIFKVSPKVGELTLNVPLWFWNSAEWCSFTQASAKTQRPTLIQALRLVRDHQAEPSESMNHELRRFFRTMVTTIRIEKSSGSPWGPFPKPKSFFEKLEKWKNGLEPELSILSGEEADKLQSVVDTIEALCTSRRVQYPHYDFTRQEVDRLLEATIHAHSAFGGSDSDFVSVDADSPRPFTGDALLKSIEATAEMMNVSEYVETLLIRLKSLLADKQMEAVIGNDSDIGLKKWLTDYIGADQAKNGCITVIDLS